MNWIKYRSVSLFFIICTVSFTCLGQKVTNNADNFPTDWIGNWSGKLEIFNSEGLQQSLNMQLLIQPIANSRDYEWSIIYGDDHDKGLRAYELQPRKTENGVWAIDEKNGIVLECFLVGNKLFSSYNVMERNFLVSYEKKGDELIFEITFGPESPISTTGDLKIDEQEEIPEVKAYEIAGRQKAILKLK